MNHNHTPIYDFYQDEKGEVIKTVVSKVVPGCEACATNKDTPQ